jgi:lipopolysaccharide/colanic/teichoic acid biosynthesis glycosyltransferase
LLGEIAVVTGSPTTELAPPQARGNFGDSPPTIAVDTLYVPTTPVEETLAFRAAKRAFDLVVALAAVIAFAPIMIVVAAIIVIEDKGPILYRQPRVGRYGVPFWFYKFRSMRVDADKIRAELLKHSDAAGAAFKMKNDPRITRIGRFIRKFSIDEMPQLFSVIAGHMSIVGPRPHLGVEVSTYNPEQFGRLLVRPGLLCLREISGRSNLSFEEWVRLDLEYVRTRSLWLDLKIFCLAIPAVLKGDGAY